MPGFAARCRQLSEARAAEPWLAAGSVIVQQQAIRDHDQAMRNYYAGTHRRPSWRKADRDEGFRIVHLKPHDVRYPPSGRCRAWAAARNIAAGHAVTARGGFRAAGPANREPQPVLLPSA